MMRPSTTRRPTAGRLALATAWGLALVAMGPAAQAAPEAAARRARPARRPAAAARPLPSTATLAVICRHGAGAPNLCDQVERLIQRPLGQTALLVPAAQLQRAVRAAPRPEMAGWPDSTIVEIGRSSQASHALLVSSERPLDVGGAGGGPRPSRLDARLVDVQTGGALWTQHYPVSRRLSAAIAAALVKEVGGFLVAARPASAAGGDLGGVPLVSAPAAKDPGLASGQPAWATLPPPRLDGPAPPMRQAVALPAAAAEVPPPPAPPAQVPAPPPPMPMPMPMPAPMVAPAPATSPPPPVAAAAPPPTYVAAPAAAPPVAGWSVYPPAPPSTAPPEPQQPVAPTPDALAVPDQGAPPAAVAAAVEGAGADTRAARPTFRLAVSGGGLRRSAKLNSDWPGTPPSYTSGKSGNPLPFPLVQAALEIYPVALAGGRQGGEGFGLQATAYGSRASTTDSGSDTFTSNVAGGEAGAAWRWIFATASGSGLDLGIAGGVGTLQFPLAEGQFPGLRYRQLYGGGRIGGAVARLVQLSVGARYLAFVDGVADGNRLGDSDRYGWGVSSDASLRWMLMRHLELSLNAFYNTFRVPFIGKTAFSEADLADLADVTLVDTQLGVSLGVGLVLW